MKTLLVHLAVLFYTLPTPLSNAPEKIQPSQSQGQLQQAPHLDRFLIMKPPSPAPSPMLIPLFLLHLPASPSLHLCQIALILHKMDFGEYESAAVKVPLVLIHLTYVNVQSFLSSPLQIINNSRNRPFLAFMRA